ncbi:DUF1801 domain-containing protein [Luteimonas sp. SDU82]|uniref:DUF1801 domain-containing protein n=1 Tax=Luteimonas sp. SDU82 TaxID=3422592 RepID=UPI003EB756BC
MSPQPLSRHASAADSSAAVDALMAGLARPHKPAIERLRRTIVDSDPAIAEGVKWNAPSFRTHEYFATVHLRAKTGIALILHRGAKARATPEGGMAIDDADGLLQWLAADRAQIVFADADDVQRRGDALQALLRQWIAMV